MLNQYANVLSNVVLTHKIDSNSSYKVQCAIVEKVQCAAVSAIVYPVNDQYSLLLHFPSIKPFFRHHYRSNKKRTNASILQLRSNNRSVCSPCSSKAATRCLSVNKYTLIVFITSRTISSPHPNALVAIPPIDPRAMAMLLANLPIATKYKLHQVYSYIITSTLSNNVAYFAISFFI